MNEQSVREPMKTNKELLAPPPAGECAVRREGSGDKGR
jgi:hypothetical protein